MAKEKMDMKLTDDEILSIVKHDYEEAKEAKDEIDDKIDTWLKEYEGEPYGNEQSGFSQLVVKDIKKAVEWFIPNAVEPFVRKNRIVRLEGITADDVQRAMMHERLLNYQFVREFDRQEFIETLFRVAATEGTAIFRNGWDFKEEVLAEDETMTQQQMQEHAAMGHYVEILDDNGDGTFQVRLTMTIKNCPTAMVLKNGNCFPDPTATSMKDAEFFIYRSDRTLGSLREEGLYDEDVIDELINTSEDANDSQLEQQRDYRNEGYGYDDDYESIDKSQKKVTVYEYWGNIDINKDGIAEPVVIAWVGNQIIRNEENPYPDKEIPFVSFPFIKVPFAFWGKPLAEFLSDNQKIRTSIMRGIIDNLAQSNNGFKFFKKGSIDVFNRKKLESKLGGAIEVNGTSQDFWDGSYNQLPPSVFNMLELVQQESESLSGINRTMQGLNSTALNSSATGAAIMQDMGQKRMMAVVRGGAEALKQKFRKDIANNKAFLGDNEVMRIAGEFIPFTRDDINGRFDIDITVGVEGVDETKANQITMLMQQIGGLQGTVDPLVLNKLLAKLADIWGFADVAAELEGYQPQPPSEAEMQAAQLQIQRLEAEIEEIKSRTAENLGQAAKYNVEAKKSAFGITDDEPATSA